MDAIANQWHSIVRGQLPKLGNARKILHGITLEAAKEHAETLPPEEKMRFLVALLAIARAASKIAAYWKDSVLAMIADMSAEHKKTANGILHFSTNQNYSLWFLHNFQDVDSWADVLNWSLIGGKHINSWVTKVVYPLDNQAQWQLLSAAAMMAIWPFMGHKRRIKFFIGAAVPVLLDNLDEKVVDFLTNTNFKAHPQLSAEHWQTLAAKLRGGALKFTGRFQDGQHLLGWSDRTVQSLSIPELEEYLQVAVPPHNKELLADAEKTTLVLQTLSPEYWPTFATHVDTLTHAATIQERLADPTMRQHVLDFVSSNLTSHLLEYVKESVTYTASPALWIVAAIARASNGDTIVCPPQPAIHQIVKDSCNWLDIGDVLHKMMWTMSIHNLVHLKFQCDGEECVLFYRNLFRYIPKPINPSTLSGYHKAIGHLVCNFNITVESLREFWESYRMDIAEPIAHWLQTAMERDLAGTKPIAEQLLTFPDELKKFLLGCTELAQLWIGEAHAHYEEELGKRRRTPTQREEPSFLCTVCLSRFYHRVAKTARITSCGHIICEDCLKGWHARGTTSCPTCRANCGRNTLPAPVPQNSAIARIMALLE